MIKKIKVWDKKLKKKKIETKSQVIKKLDKVFSQYIRLSKSDENWIWTCYTCWKKDHRKHLQNWHFFSRARYNTRWEERNCEIQDYSCNIIRSWNYIVYTRKKLKERWEKLFNEREQFSKQLSKFKITDLREKLEYYKEKVKELEKLKKPLKKEYK